MLTLLILLSLLTAFAAYNAFTTLHIGIMPTHIAKLLSPSSYIVRALAIDGLQELYGVRADGMGWDGWIIPLREGLRYQIG